MNKQRLDRRDFLSALTAVGAIDLPLIGTARPRSRAGRPPSGWTAYDPKAALEIDVRDVEFRRTRASAASAVLVTQLEELWSQRV